MGLVALAFSLAHIPIRQGKGQKLGVAILWLTVAATAGALIPLTYDFWLSGAYREAGVLRLAGLLFALTVIALAWARESSPSPLIEALVEIRRQLGTGRLDASDAAKQMDIVLAGLRLDDVLQQDLASVISLLEDYGREIAAADRELAALEAKVEEPAFGASDADATVMKALVDTSGKHVTSGSELLDRAAADLKRLVRRLNFHTIYGKERDPATARIQQSLARAVEAAEAQRSAYRQRLPRVRQKLLALKGDVDRRALPPTST